VQAAFPGFAPRQGRVETGQGGAFRLSGENGRARIHKGGELLFNRVGGLAEGRAFLGGKLGQTAHQLGQ
jgi:hypothetical protein